jgi:D-alanyl-D-alanine dipeptidase
VYAHDLHELLDRLKSDPDYVDVSTLPCIAVDLRYATTDNFTGINLYGPFNLAFLHRFAANMLATAAASLQQREPGHRLLVLDATRPPSVQQKLWDHVAGTAMQAYIADPAKGSIHNFGLAVDLTIIDADGNELDMGTAYDTFDPLSQPALEVKFETEGKLTGEQIANRKLLRRIMEEAGFIQLPHEWWHYDALSPDAVREQYQVIK